MADFFFFKYLNKYETPHLGRIRVSPLAPVIVCPKINIINEKHNMSYMCNLIYHLKKKCNF